MNGRPRRDGMGGGGIKENKKANKKAHTHTFVYITKHEEAHINVCVMTRTDTHRRLGID